MPARKKAAPTRSRAATPVVDRDAEFERVRGVVRKHMPLGYVERLAGKMLVWEVPLSVYPDTYNGQPLWYAAMAPQKNYLTLHVMAAYGSPVLAKRLADGFAAAGKRLHMGKACIRFTRADDLALDVIGEVVAAVPMARWVAMAKSVRRKR